MGAGKLWRRSTASLSVAALAMLSGCDGTETEVMAPLDVEPLSAWSIPLDAMASAWSADKTCVGDATMEGTYIECSCSAGLEFDSTQGDECYCINGSENEGCMPDEQEGGGGDPSDPPGPGNPGEGDDYRKVELTCPSTVTRGSSATCQLTVTPSFAQVGSIAWSADVPDVSPTKSGGMSWGGEISDTTTVWVSVAFLGAIEHLSATINVAARSWSWSYTGGQAAAGAIDACEPTTSPAGFTSGASCTSTNKTALFTPALPTSGYDVHTISDNGPNHGRVYIKSPTITMNVLAQVNQKYRSDGPTHSVTSPAAVVQGCQSQFGSPIPNQTTYSVNNTCVTTYKSAFNNLLATIWNHEGKHVTEATAEAGASNNDVHAALEGFTGSDSGDVLYQAVAAINPIHQRILDKSLAVDVGGTTSSYTFYRWNGSGFPVQTVSVKN